MIQFNELRITPNSQYLIIDISIDKEHPEASIKDIIIDTQDTYFVEEPSAMPVYTYNAEEGTKNLRIELTEKDVGNLDTNMFFIYITVDNQGETPIIMKTVVNLYPFYQAAIEGLKELNISCQPPKNFIDALLRFKALELTIKTGNYTEAINYWRTLFTDRKTINTNCSCSCKK